MSTAVAVLASVLTVAVIGVWGLRTVRAEHAIGTGGGQLIRRSSRIRRLDVTLWVLGVTWGASLLTYLGLGLTGR